MGLENKINDFCFKYEARVGSSNKYLRRAVPVPLNVNDLEQNYSFPVLEHTNIKLIEITLPEDRFRALIEFDSWIENAGKKVGHLNSDMHRISKIVENNEKEFLLRQQYPALQKAWENYMIILGMIDNGQF